ncbi:unnamed protein product, partial [marine sediment metagenome]
LWGNGEQNQFGGGVPNPPLLILGEVITISKYLYVG